MPLVIFVLFIFLVGQMGFWQTLQFYLGILLTDFMIAMTFVVWVGMIGRYSYIRTVRRL